VRDLLGPDRVALMATTLPDDRYRRAALDNALASAVAAWTAAEASTGRCCFCAWADVCRACDRSAPGFSASHLHRGSGLVLAALAPTVICLGCGGEMERAGVASVRFAADSLTPRAALERVLADHLRVLTRALSRPTDTTLET
jgi:hypothetical protein